MRKKAIALSLASHLKVTARAREAFLRHGFEAMTMVTLAKECNLTRRALYYYFSSKEEAFRAMIRLENTEALESGYRAAQKVLEKPRATALDAVAEWIDARYGNTRRNLSTSSFARDINDAAFRVCADVLTEFAKRTNDELARLLRDLQGQKLLRLERTRTAPIVARLLADGARGVNQARPPVSNSALPQRYREISNAILYGCAKR
jgi:AcrR family transcriptional regulator